MKRQNRGFTVIELMIVVVLGTIMTSMAIKGFGMVSNQASAREARNVFQGMVARTRAQAIESGLPSILIADAQGDSVMIIGTNGIMENVRFGEEMGVDIQTTERLTRICMNPRGFANTDCNSFTSAIKMSFVRGPKSKSIEILPLGQIRW
ncbi:MAG: prepilin-type N-terminal cleavage/methylation domain-containing protein [Gemmatimonadetes bacterium]|nr:prepilin-type N-terminal cleavage/methylation domain-containing protein [Gemmatimonadota bacterium]NNM03490.1 prepilin-type N-terminal cleavage/methylation domain-containing protein [Gemmatimonadota bacterium]